MDRHHNDSQPTEFLVENIELLSGGRVLDVAMGEGRNAIYLAKKGFQVEGVDISPEGVRTARQAARQAGVSLKAHVADLESSYTIDKDAYDVIVCINYLYRPLIPQIKQGLRRGGMLVYETFTVDQARFGKPRNPDHLLKPNELLHLFLDFLCLRYREGVFENRRAIASIVAQRV